MSGGRCGRRCQGLGAWQRLTSLVHACAPGSSVAWSPDSRYFACGNSDTATICDPTTGAELLRLGTGDSGPSGAGLANKQQPLPGVAWSPDGHQLATAGMIQRLWDLHTKYPSPRQAKDVGDPPNIR
jgi:WD40 repeat protein